MIRTLSLAALLAAAFALPGAPAFAQAKSKAKQCQPGWEAVCVKACSQRGGQPRMCPGYCAKQMRDNGC